MAIGLLILVGTMSVSAQLSNAYFQLESSTITLMISGFIIYSYTLLIGNICRVYINKIQLARKEVQQQKDEILKANKDIRQTNEVIKTVNSTLSLEAIMDSAMEAMTQTLNYNQMCLFIPNPTSKKLIPSHFRGEKVTNEIISGIQSMEFKLKPKVSMISDAFLENRVIVVSPMTTRDDELLSKGDRMLLTTNPLQAVMAHPLNIQGRTVGVIVFTNTDAPFDDLSTSMGTLERYISQIAGAVNNALIYQEITKAKQLAELGTKAKSEFLANMSHEIRTPMNAILGLLTMARHTDDSNSRLDYLEKIETSAHNLLAIVNDILDFSKIEAGKLELENNVFKLDTVVSEVEGLLGIKAAEKGLSLTISIDNHVPNNLYGDSLRLGQVLINLVGNAIKFTTSGEINIHIGLVEKDENLYTLQFSIQDTGIGLSKQQRANLFQSFSQADTSVTRKFGGTGLGLSISKHYVELMGGNIWVESQLNKGSTFRFTVNFKSENQTSSKPKQNIEPSKIKILVVSTNKELLKSLSLTLQQINCIPLFAMTEQQAAAQLSKDGNNISAMLIDQLNDLSAENFVENILNNTQIQSLPALFKILNMTDLNEEELAINGQAMEESVNINTFSGFIYGNSTADKLKESLSVIVGPLSKSEIDKGDDQLTNDAERELAGLNVLLVEDNDINQTVAKFMLEQANINVTIVNNGQEALDRLSNSDLYFDAVLMDIQMPVMDGHTATKKIRTLGNSSAFIPIIAMTAHAFESEKQKCFESGMNDHIAKPINAQIIYKVLAKWTGRKESQKEEEI